MSALQFLPENQICKNSFIKTKKWDFYLNLGVIISARWS